MPLPGPFELVIILVIILLVFGVGKLPEVGGALGKGIREFKKNSGIDSSDAKQSLESPAPANVERPASTVERPAEERPATKV